MTGQPLLAVAGLSVAFGPEERPVRAVRAVDLTIGQGEIVGIVGESGSGKSTLCAALTRALPRTARLSGRVTLNGADLYGLSPRALRDVRRHDLTMVLQNPMTALDPLFTVGNQLTELLAERGAPQGRGGGLRDEATRLLGQVHLTAPALRMRQYPHELSGGMKQRVLIAMATASSPKLLIADEPTSALDATIQDEILLLFREARDRAGTSVVIVSHDLGAIRRVSDRTVIMYAGQIVEDGPTAEVFRQPGHPYTRALLGSLPHLVDDDVTLTPIPGQVPRLDQLGPGCAFAERCASALGCCHSEPPVETAIDPTHRVYCWGAA
jgi:oligopeptide/dipeptide ABC transporter ATP-binding protein